MRNTVLIALGWSVLAGTPSEVRAHSWKFTRLVDHSTPIPGGTGTFNMLQAPSFDGRNIAFRGGRAWGAEAIQDGIYSTARGLHAVANLNTPVPGGTGAFTSFGTFPAIDRGEVVFWGCGDAPGCSFAPVNEGIYSDRNGLHVVADTRTPVPGGSGNFRIFGSSSVRNGQITFVGRGPGTQSGVYTNIGGLQVVVDTQTPVPGGAGTFASFGSPSIAGGHVAFDGLAPGPGSGIYTDVGGLTVVADESTPVPGGTSLFRSMHGPSFDGKNVAFWGCGPRAPDPSCGFPWAEGIYSDVGGLHVVADTDTPVPEGNGTFSWFGSPTIDAGNVAFTGASTGGIGVYLRTAATGTLEKVLAPGDMLDGKTVVSCTLGEAAMRGLSLAPIVTFSDGTSAIYRADRIDVTLGVRGVPNPVRVGTPFTLLWSLKNEGATVDGTLVLALVTAEWVVPVGVASFPVPSGIDWRDLPLACFPYPQLPTSGWLLALFDRRTGALLSVALDIVTVDGTVSREEALEIQGKADAFVETFPGPLPKP